ncbi:uncharacterized protein Ecym_7095 [Eremothecium cymbalariae DBVPG|uniref:RRM domain-containing protein n=1 Tax=Eremothecium cymbalariae (strain CBS 270.75 / DBVPG 7215 / KCTC 17166 / NRRL Y-17582) TaxID=931890 RepID=G8JVT2_ERECY|nr:hypothetical protein Ecym_7095 [Eremothecium cymbalariae DBVPG\
MTHSVIISNIPLEVSNVTVMKFIQLNELVVEHIQPFPDEYHHINEEAQTKTLQIFTHDDEGKHLISDLFSDISVMDKMLDLEKLVKCGPNSVPRGERASEQEVGGTQGTTGRGSLSRGRRISVTIL